MKLCRDFSFIIVAFFLDPCFASAHPGHEPLANGPAHLWQSPYHLLALLFVATTASLAARVIQQRLLRRLVRLGGVAALLGAVLLASLGH